MQNNTARLLWLILLGNIAIVETAPPDAGGGCPEPSNLPVSMTAFSPTSRSPQKRAEILPSTRESSRKSPKETQTTPNAASQHKSQSSSSAPHNPYGQWLRIATPDTNIPIDIHILNTRLRLALDRRSIKGAKRLIEQGADVNTQSGPNKDDNALLHLAVQKGDIKLVKWLLAKKRASANIVDHYGITPLHIAAFFNKCKIARYLILVIPDVNPVDNKGNTPLHLAAYKGREDFVKILLKSRADRDLLNYGGETAAKVTKQRSIIRMLADTTSAEKEEKSGTNSTVEKAFLDRITRYSLIMKKRRSNPYATTSALCCSDEESNVDDEEEKVTSARISDWPEQ